MSSMIRRHGIAVKTLLGLAIGLGISVPLAGADWPQWQGPNRDNHSGDTGLLKAWPESGPALAWKITGLGTGFSAGSVVNGVIYIMGDLRDGSYVMALNESDGKQIWATKVGEAGQSGGQPGGPRATPTIDGDRLYVIGRAGEIACLETKTGKEVWHKHFMKDFGGTFPQWGFAESPLVDGEKVICTPGGKQGTVIALDKKDGATVWRSTDWTDSAHYSCVLAATIGGVPQYVQFTAQSVAGLAPADGKVLWRANRQGKTAVIPTPVLKDDMVFVSSGYGIGCNLFKVSHDANQFSAAQSYADKIMTIHHGGMVRVGDYVYGACDDGNLRCVEMKTGKEMWKDACVGKGSITYADGYLYVRGEGREGKLALVEATPSGYQKAGMFAQPERTRVQAWAHPVVANGKFYVRDQDLLLCYDVKAK